MVTVDETSKVMANLTLIDDRSRQELINRIPSAAQGKTDMYPGFIDAVNVSIAIKVVLFC